jgi:glycosyltransferase involved in cell wall biosynthesis
MKILVIIPAYNEEANLPNVLDDLRGFSGDVLVVNDGSTDSTAEVARSRGVAHVSHPFNLGIGGTMQTGFTYAWRNGYDMAIQFDGDGQHRADQLGLIIAKVAGGEADLAIGVRTVPGGYRMGPTRLIGSKFFLYLIRLLTGRSVADPTSGFRCYGKKTIELFVRYYPDDYPEVESIITACRNGLRIVDVPVLMRPRVSGNSSITRLKSAYYMLKVTLALLVDSMRNEVLTEEG